MIHILALTAYSDMGNIALQCTCIMLDNQLKY